MDGFIVLRVCELLPGDIFSSVSGVKYRVRDIEFGKIWYVRIKSEFNKLPPYKERIEPNSAVDYMGAKSKLFVRCYSRKKDQP